MASLAERALRLDVDNYHRLRFDTDRRTELIDGRIVETNPIGTAHRVVVTRLQRQLDAFNHTERLLVQQSVQLGSHDEPQPDLAILRGPQPLRPVRPSDVELIIEVSDSTLARDRAEKLPRYQLAGVRVWIVNIADHAAPRLEVYDPANPDPPAVLTSGQVQASQAPAVMIDLDALFEGLAGLPYDELP
jgi:Uma2 family endonuclease